MQGKNYFLHDGSDLTHQQIEALTACLGSPSQVMIATTQQLFESGVSQVEIEDLVKKGYLEALSDGRYLVPRDVDGDAMARRLTDITNTNRVSQMVSGMFGDPNVSL